MDDIDELLFGDDVPTLVMKKKSSTTTNKNTDFNRPLSDDELKKHLKAIRREERGLREQIIKDEQSGADGIAKILRKWKLEMRGCGNGGGGGGSSGQEPFALMAQHERDLLPHQVQGVKWLADRHYKGTGCVLADEMGLGKTVQISSFIGCGIRCKLITTTIVVAPTSLIENWVQELRKWSGVPDPAKQVVSIHGKSARDRKVLWRRLSFKQPVIFVTSYGLFKNDAELINVNRPDYVVLDEAQLIRNATSEVAKVAHKVTAHHRIAVTGTPIMNSFKDLWSLMEFVDPNAIGENRAQFASTNDDLMKGNERGNLSRREAASQKLDALKEKVGPYILRREKESVAGMKSKKSDYVIWVQPSRIQAHHYQEFVKSKEVQFGLQRISTHHPLTLLNALKHICDHTWLNMTEMNFRNAMQDPTSVMEGLDHFGNIAESAKMDVAINLLRKHQAEGHKTLVFSQSKRLLHMLSHLMKRPLPTSSVVPASEEGQNPQNHHGGDIPHCQIDGDLPIEERHQYVTKFNKADIKELSACLLTTQVGGVGLTFNSATRVIMLDPSWNPAVDAQAVDRVHRLGQEQDVITYRLVTCGTVEEKIYRNQIHKMMAARQVIADHTELLVRYFSHVQLHTMFEVGMFDFAETAAQLAETHPDMTPHVDTSESIKQLSQFVVSISNHLCVFSNSKVMEMEEEEERRRTRKAIAGKNRSKGGGGGGGRRKTNHQQEREKRDAKEIAALPDDADELVELLLTGSTSGGLSQQDESNVHHPSGSKDHPAPTTIDVATDIASIRLSTNAFQQPCVTSKEDDMVPEEEFNELHFAANSCIPGRGSMVVAARTSGRSSHDWNANDIHFRGHRIPKLDVHEITARLTLEKPLDLEEELREEAEGYGGGSLGRDSLCYDDEDEDADYDEPDWNTLDRLGAGAECLPDEDPAIIFCSNLAPLSHLHPSDGSLGVVGLPPIESAATMDDSTIKAKCIETNITNIQQDHQRSSNPFHQSANSLQNAAPCAPRNAGRVAMRMAMSMSKQSSRATSPTNESFPLDGPVLSNAVSTRTSMALEDRQLNTTTSGSKQPKHSTAQEEHLPGGIHHEEIADFMGEENRMSTQMERLSMKAADVETPYKTSNNAAVHHGGGSLSPPTFPPHPAPQGSSNVKHDASPLSTSRAQSLPWNAPASHTSEATISEPVADQGAVQRDTTLEDGQDDTTAPSAGKRSVLGGFMSYFFHKS